MGDFFSISPEELGLRPSEDTHVPSGTLLDFPPRRPAWELSLLPGLSLKDAALTAGLRSGPRAHGAGGGHAERSRALALRFSPVSCRLTFLSSMRCPEGSHALALPSFLLGQPEWVKTHRRELARSSYCTNQSFVSLNLFCFDAKLEKILSSFPTLSWSSLEFSAWISDSPAGREGRCVGPHS